MPKRIRQIPASEVHDPQKPKTLVLSPKAQLYLEYAGFDMRDLERFTQLRDKYLEARTLENIKAISTHELERIVRNGLTLATRGAYTQ